LFYFLTYNVYRVFDTISKNDVISSVLKHYCAGLELELGLEVRFRAGVSENSFRSNAFSRKCRSFYMVGAFESRKL